ncbi:MAG: peptidase M50 [Methanocorpusculum sp.]|nr:peptidase M50 [Methanocorpusculum sp.]
MGLFKKISPFEKKDLFIAWIALTIAFTIALFAKGGLVNLISQAVGGNFSGFNGTMLLIAFVASLIIVGLSFVLHEMAHKYSAIHFGYWAEFRKSNPMLVMSLCLAVLLGVVFAAPGATVINTAGRQMTQKENGIISILGPITNLILLVIFAALMIFGIFLGGGQIIAGGIAFSFTGAGFLFYLGYSGWLVNAMLAFFNMLPVGPLDGKKVLRWNPVAFILVIAASAFLLYMPFDTNLMMNFVGFFFPAV